MSKCPLCPHNFEQWEERYTLIDDETGKVLTICWKCAGRDSAVFTDVITEGIPLNQSLKPTGVKPGVKEGYVLTPLPPAEQNELYTQQLIRATQKNFLLIGKLLKENRNNKYWALHHQSWHDYIESLGLAQRTAYLMIECWDLQSVAKLEENTILEIGIAKTQLLIPLARQGRLTSDIIELAKVSPVRDLKEALGHKIVENDKEEFIKCPHCGEEIRGAKWVKK